MSSQQLNNKMVDGVDMTRLGTAVQRASSLIAAGVVALSAGQALSDEVKAEEAPAPTPKFATFSLLYKADLMGVVDGGDRQAGRMLDALDVAADLDFETGFGIKGLTGRIELMTTGGGEPNGFAGALQGVDNIEVGHRGTRLYQAFLEQSLANGAFSVRVGFSDLNSEFYVNDSAGLLLAPPFGIGTEMAVTGQHGPSIFPSTSFAVRLKYRFGEAGYVQAGVYNENSGDLGDPKGPDWRFRTGGLAIAEAGLTKGGKTAIGVWRYTRKVDQVYADLLTGAVGRSESQGAYLLIERDLCSGKDGVRATTGFVRAGLADSRTDVVDGGLQSGIKVSQVLASRPESMLSIGYSWAHFSRRFRSQNGPLASGEHLVEITLSDRIAPHLTIQPDLQWIRRADPVSGRDVVVAGLRLVAGY